MFKLRYKSQKSKASSHLFLIYYLLEIEDILVMNINCKEFKKINKIKT